MSPIVNWFIFKWFQVNVFLMARVIKVRLAKDANLPQNSIKEVAEYLVTQNIKPTDISVDFYVSYCGRYNQSAFSTTYISRRNKPHLCVIIKRFSETHASTLTRCGIDSIKEFFLDDSQDKEGDAYIFY